MEALINMATKGTNSKWPNGKMAKLQMANGKRQLSKMQIKYSLYTFRHSVAVVAVDFEYI